MRHKASGKHVILPPHTKFWENLMINTSGVPTTEFKLLHRTGRSVCQANGIHEVVASQQFKNLVTYFSAAETKIPNGGVISFVPNRPNIHLTVTGATATGICKTINVIVEQPTSAFIEQLKTYKTNVISAAANEKIAGFTPANEDLLLSSASNKHGPVPMPQKNLSSNFKKRYDAA